MCIINEPETEIHSRQTTTSTPEQFIAGLIDFGPSPSNFCGNSSDEYVKVHHSGRSKAGVTEGSGSIWEHLITTGAIPAKWPRLNRSTGNATKAEDFGKFTQKGVRNV